MVVIGIDTSCDDASVAIAENDRLLANVISSQVAYHSFWGGVVPGIARRRHQETIDGVISYALKQAGKRFEDIDIVAVTVGPGLAIALEVGIEKAREIASKYTKPIVAVNHMEGHIYANFAKNRNGMYFSTFRNVENELNEGSAESVFPLISLLISGGHTELVYMRKHIDYQLLGKKLDDAVGEAYDKVARMLSLCYPGGPIIEKLAREGDRRAYEFPVSMKDGTLRFSYSGLKTAVMRTIEQVGEKSLSLREKHLLSGKDTASGGLDLALSKKPTYILTEKIIKDVAASFEYAACEQLKYKLSKSLMQHPEVRYVLLGGGVVSNLYVRSSLRSIAKENKVKLIYPITTKLTTDNAGMIAIAGYYKAIKKGYSDLSLIDRKPQWELDQV